MPEEAINIEDIIFSEDENSNNETISVDDIIFEPGKTTGPASSDTDSGSESGSSVLLDRIEAGDYDYEIGEAPVEEEETSTHSLIRDIPSRQDNNIAAINEQAILRGQDEENKQELFEQFKIEHGTENPVEAVTNQYGKDVFMEKTGPETVVYPFPENPEGFLLNDPDFWSNTNNREQHRQLYINKRSNEERTNFEKKFATKEDVDNTIISQGDNYISLEDMDIAKLRRDGKEDEADKLAKDRGYVQLLDNEGNLKGWIPQGVEDKATSEGESKDKDVLEEQRRQAYFKLIAASKLAHENAQPGTHPYLNTLGDVSLGKSLVHNVRDLFGDDSTIDDVMARLGDVNNSSELVAGLHKLPSKTATARTFNNALDEFVTMNRALEINADLSKLKEENFFKEIVAPTNDKVVETFSGMMEVNGYEMSPDAIKRAGSDWGGKGGLSILGEEYELRDVLEGGRDVASHLAPLAASVWLTKKLPVGGKEKLVKVGDKMQKVFKTKSFSRALDQRTNILGRYLKNTGPQSRVYKNAVDLTLGGIKETVILGMADKPAEKIFGSDPFVYNEKTDEFTPVFPFALGFGNAAAAKILNRLNTTKNFFTPALATISRSGTAQAALEANIGATVGTATMFFAEEITKGVDNWQNLGYESEEEMKQDHGFKNLVETYIGMLMFQSVSPAMGQNALSKLGRGMHSDIMRATTGLTPRARKAMKFFGIEKNKKGEFNLQEVKNSEGQKIYEVSKDKSLTEAEKQQKIEEIKNQSEELIFHNELKLAKELAKGEGKYREYLTNTFDIANKLKTGKKPTANDIQRFNNLTDVEFSWLKKKFGVTENSEFSKMLDNKHDVYKSIVDIVDGQRLHQISPEARNKQIELYLKQSETAGEIQMLTKQVESSPHLKAVNAEKIKKLQEKQKVNAEELVKNEELYDKILKDKFKTEVEFSKLMTRELGAGFNLVGEEAFVKMGGTKGSEGFFNRKTNQVYINEKAALEARQLGTPLHEVTHAILKNSLKESYTDDQGVERTRVSKEGMTKINQFLNQLTSKEKSAVEKRMEKEYKYYRDSNGDFILRNGEKIVRPKNEYAEEYLTAFGDVLKNKEVVETPDLAGRISNFFTPIMRQAGFKNMQVTAESGKGLYNMIKAIQKSSETGVIDRDVLNIAKTSKKVTGKAIVESRTVTEAMEKSSSEIQKLWNERDKNPNYYNDIIERIKGNGFKEIINGREVEVKRKDFIEFYTEIYRDHAKYSELKEDLYREMAIDPTYGVLGAIISYNPAKNPSMASHIFGRMNQGKHIDVANRILGKDAARQFTKSLDIAEAKEVEAKQLTAEELTDIALAKEKIQQAPNLRKSMVKGEEKGINQDLINKVADATTTSFLYTKRLPGEKGFKKELTDNFKRELKEPLANWLGKGAEYEIRLRENFDAIMKFGDKKYFVDAERLLPRDERVFTEVEIESMSVKETDKAIREERVPKNTSRTAGNTLWKFKMPAPAQFIKFYTPPKTKISEKKIKEWDKMSLAEKQKYAKKIKEPTLKEAREKYITVGSGLKGTRKDKLAEMLGEVLAKDMASTVMTPELIARLKGIKTLEISKELEGLEKELRPEGEIFTIEGKEIVTTPDAIAKIIEAREMLFDNYTEKMASEIARDPNLAFSYTEKQFKQDVKELKALVKKAELFGDVFDIKTSKPLVRRKDGTEYNEIAYTHVLDGYWNNLLDFNVTRYKNKLIADTGKKSTTKGTAYEYYTEESVKKQLKALGLKGDVKVTSEVTEKQIYLDPQGNFKGGKVQAPDFVIDWNGTKQTWELKYKSARTPKNSAGFVDYTQAYKDIIAGKEFKLTERKSPRKNPKEEAIFVESVKQAILNGVPKVEAALRKHGVLAEGENFTSRTKIPLEVHLLINGKEKALMADASQKINGDWVAADYNKKGVNIFQMATKGAFYLGTDWTGMAKEAGATKLETNAPLMTRVYSSSYKKVVDGKEVTAGYTYNLVGEGVISPKNITSKSTLNLDSPGAIKKMANTPSAKRIKRMAEAEATALKANKKIASKTGVISESKTNRELIGKAKIVDKALENSRKINKKSRGMSTWDFDDTLATTKSGVRARIPNTDGKPKPNRKVIFLAGGAGSGKGNVIKKLNLEKQGFKIVNSDISLEWLKKNNGLPENMNDLTKEQRSKLGSLQHQARGIAKRKMMKYKGNADGVVVDGTGGSIKAMEKLVNEFKDKGYDVSMLFVETSLETALARNKARTERSLLDKIVERNHESVQGNKPGFKTMFGDRFMEVKTDNLKQKDAMPGELVAKMNDFVSSYEKIRLDAEQFATEGQGILDRGGKFDFAEFNVVTGGEKGPFFQKALDRAKKFGTKDQFVLTARPPEAAGPIYEFLKSQGLEVPLENITGLGNSTGEAKALWMLKKFSEGYNNMYFADDAMQNVKAVRDVLNQLDIKSKVQQAVQESRTSLNIKVNKIMEHSLDIGSEKVFSKAEAKVRGKDIKRRRIFMRDSAADLELLIEPLYGKGKEGIKNKKWFKEEFVMPFERGIRDYNTARQSAKNDYMSLRKQNKDVVKEISKPVKGTAFTNDMAMRVYLWNKAGYKIPDLAKTTEAKLVQHIANNPKLQAYAENFARITKQEKGLKEPGENWWGETMAGEVTNINRGVSRKQYLQEWIERKNEIFTEENLNKMESKLGTQWRENITDMFDRMETGRTRSLKMDRGSTAMMNYLNGGIGTIMNFNTRSAVLQTISTTNFLNMRENNPIAAARAMGNVKQFAKDFKYIMNSDMLKQRRDGLAMNVTEAEIASAAASSKNPVQSIISKVLKAGYLPTKMADSFAISFGGATFYRNRIKMYEKQGMKTKEAEKQAFLDFQVIAERTQQSSRADLLSKQQTSLIGRFILPFANTPMQMNRAGMKDILDISKGRYKNNAEVAEKVGRISYYMGAQVAIFAGLQSALFAMLLNDDDVPEEKLANTKSMMLNTTADSMLRGFGVQGAVLSATKNALQEYFKQSAKPGFTADYSEVAEDLLNISPPIGSKFGMLDRAGDRKKWAKIRKNDEFKFELGNPSLEASLMTVQAVTNAPVYSPYQNIFNMQHALSDQYETWQRVLMGAGWTPYSVGVETEDKKKKKKSSGKRGKVRSGITR